MRIARASIDKGLITWLLMFCCLLGGVWGFATMGRLEDPAFTIKKAVVITQYPGASAAQVAREVSEPLESAIQQMAEVDHITSSNKPGVSRITVEIENTYDGGELPQIWDDLRNRVGDAQVELPEGAGPSQVNDSFGDVYGLFFAVTAPGFTDAEVHELAEFLRREILAVEGVADVTLGGLPDEAIFVQPEIAILTNLGLPPAAIIEAIANANAVASAGAVNADGRNIRIEAPSGSDTVEDIQSLAIGVGGEVLQLDEIA